MKFAAALIVLLAVAAPGLALADAPADMAATANGFYKVYQAIPRIGGVPDAAARARYAAFLSPGLVGLLNQAAATETRTTKKFKAVPPLFEGDLFTSMFEGATSWTVESCSGNDKVGTCRIGLIHQGAGKPLHWTDELAMVATPGGWKIDDVAYKAGFHSGNSGTLREMLRMTLIQAGQ